MKNNDIKFETLKKPIRKKIIIGSVVAIAVVSAITINASWAKYRLTQSIPVVRGKIYYYNGDLNVMAVKASEDGTNYNDTDTIPTSGYTFNATKSVCKIPSGDTYVEDKTIPMEYKDGKVYIGVSKKKTKCYLYFNKINGIISSQILAYVKSKSNGVKSSFSTPATTNEGIFEASDGMYGGTSYYWRGAVTDNHVILANYCWRIIRINGDGTIRMIYNGVVQSGNTCLGNGKNGTNVQIGTSVYNSSTNASYYVGWTQNGTQRSLSGTNSTIKTYTENWYKANIIDKGHGSKVAIGKFCNDRNVASGSTWSANGAEFEYVAYSRLNTPTLSCSVGDTYNINVGLLTADEVVFAGERFGWANSAFYLHSGENYTLFTPYGWDGNNSSQFSLAGHDGRLVKADLDASLGVRPVINLSTSVTFNADSEGSSSNPYIVQ